MRELSDMQNHFVFLSHGSHSDRKTRGRGGASMVHSGSELMQVFLRGSGH
jgi:hypothetical protein